MHNMFHARRKLGETLVTFLLYCLPQTVGSGVVATHSSRFLHGWAIALYGWAMALYGWAIAGLGWAGRIFFLRSYFSFYNPVIFLWLYLILLQSCLLFLLLSPSSVVSSFSYGCIFPHLRCCLFFLLLYLLTSSSSFSYGCILSLKGVESVLFNHHHVTI